MARRSYESFASPYFRLDRLVGATRVWHSHDSVSPRVEGQSYFYGEGLSGTIKFFISRPDLADLATGSSVAAERAWLAAIVEILATALGGRYVPGEAPGPGPDDTNETLGRFVDHLDRFVDQYRNALESMAASPTPRPPVQGPGPEPEPRVPGEAP